MRLLRLPIASLTAGAFRRLHHAANNLVVTGTVGVTSPPVSSIRSRSKAPDSIWLRLLRSLRGLKIAASLPM
jgi:hypothetical protein